MSASRRFVAGLIRLGLVVLMFVLVVGYVRGRLHRGQRNDGGRERHVTAEMTPPGDSLGAGDIRVYNADSSVDLVLMGDKILAGLSPKTVATVKTTLDTSGKLRDTTGFAGGIAQIVKKSVAGAIGTHVVYQVADVADIRYENEQIVVDWKDGGKHELFGKTNVNGRRVQNTFRPDEAKKFVDAVHARMNR